MKNSIKRAQSQARLSFAERENFRPKVRQLKKTLLTLVALLAVTTGAWADVTWSLSGSTLTISGTGAIENYVDFHETPWYDNIEEIKTIVIESGVTSIGNNAFENCTYLESVSIPASVTSIGFNAFKNCGSDATALTVSIAEGSTPLTIGGSAFENANLKSIDIPNRVTSIGGYAFTGCNNLELVSIPASVTSIGEEAFSNCSKLANVYIYAPSLTTYGAAAFDGNASGRKISVPADAVDTYKAGWSAYAADIEAMPGSASASSGPEVAWNKAEKTGSFTMPGGNVTLEPEYYPQAALATAPTAINDVPATTDGAIVSAGTVKNIGETTTAQGTVMYYVSPTALDDAALQALAADQWTADVPTAAGLAQGQAYVYYYVRGNDSDTDDKIFSDGDILAANALTVTIAAEPTYAVTFAEGTDPNEWSADPNADVKKGETVTVTYTGAKKVIGVKAEKKASTTYTLLSAATAEDCGKVVCAAGHLHDAKTAVPTGCTAVGILGVVTDTGHGLILSLQDATEQKWNTINGWTSASYAGTTLKVLTDDACGTNLTSYTALGETAVSNWAVAQKSDYEAIFTNLGTTAGDSDGMTYDANVNAYITTGVGGTAISGTCWSATGYEDDHAWYFNSAFWNYNAYKEDSFKFRPVLGF